MYFQPYRPSVLLKSGHINTLYPYFFRKIDEPAYLRIKVDTPDEDFLELDLLQKGNKRVVIICHGLEGSSSSQYVKGTAQLLEDSGWDVIAFNYRFCGGNINNKARMYHSGATDDLETVLQYADKSYSTICLVGFSLGGNLVLKYCGEQSDNIRESIRAAISISCPLDLEAGSRNIGKRSNFIYEKNFLKSLSSKVIQKHKQFPDLIPIEELSKVKTLFDFDDRFTAPIHGFKDAIDYYTQCSSKRFVGEIKIPTLIINALDDPFLPKECYPLSELSKNEKITFLTPKHGGHVGFADFKNKYYWNELQILKFIGTYD